MYFRITIRSVVPKEARHALDAEMFNDGDSWTYAADNLDDALDEFHGAVPIKVLDHYEIECEEIDKTEYSK